MPEYDGDTPDGETLLYDFSKNVGDTIWHNLLVQGGRLYMGENITASIIYDIVDSEYGKVYETAQYINNGLDGNGFIDLHPMMGRTDSWIEGIGSLSGLFWFLDYPSMSGGSSFKLVCFKQSSAVIYMDNANCNSCFCWSSAGISKIKSIPIEVKYENNN